MSDSVFPELDRSFPTLVNRRPIWENQVFRLFADDLIAEGHDPVNGYLVVAPKNRSNNLVSGIGVLPIVDGLIGLISIYRHPVGQVVWEIPRGFVDQGETPEVAATRELFEETGLKCAETDLAPLGSLLPEAGVLAGRIQLFAATNSVASPDFVPEELGFRAFKLFKRSEVDLMIAAREIEDPCTLVSYLKYSLTHCGKRANGPGIAKNARHSSAKLMTKDL